MRWCSTTQVECIASESEDNQLWQAMIEATKIPNLPNNDPVKELRAHQLIQLIKKWCFWWSGVPQNHCFPIKHDQFWIIFRYPGWTPHAKKHLACYLEEYMMAASVRICAASLGSWRLSLDMRFQGHLKSGTVRNPPKSMILAVIKPGNWTPMCSL